MPYLYAAYMKIPGFPFTPVKVGFTANPERRKDDYRHGPFPVEMIGFWEGAQDDEREFHREYTEYRINGEWYVPTPDIMDAINGNIMLEQCASVSWEPSAELEAMAVRLKAQIEATA